jgi:glycosyltransferase involved in cell wall biosynthesis
MVYKILHILGDSEHGGGSFIVEEICKAANLTNYQASALTTDPLTHEVFSRSGVGVIDLDCIWRPIRPLKDIYGLIKLVLYLRSSDFDIIHTHTSKAGFVGRLAAFLARKKVIIHTIHGFAFHENSSPRKVYFYTILEKIAALCCDRLVSVSNYHRKWALDLKICNSDKIVTISNGINDISCSKDPLLGISDSSNNGDPTRKIITLGRLAKQKGIEYLIEAVQQVVINGTQDFLCILIGDGPEYDTFVKKIEEFGLEEYFCLLGYCEKPRNLLCHADFIVLPTEREGLSIALLESMASGKPVITTSIGSNCEVTDNGKSAYLVEPADAKELARAIELFLDFPEISTSYGFNGLERFKECYTISSMKKKYLDLYDGLIKEKLI